VTLLMIVMPLRFRICSA